MGELNIRKFFLSLLLLFLVLLAIDLIRYSVLTEEGYFYDPPKQESQPQKQQNLELEYPPEGEEEPPKSEPLKFA
jgi:hypothetical protein